MTETKSLKPQLPNQHVISPKYFRLFFKASSDGTLPRFSGALARGMFFNALDLVDKHLAKDIHDQDGILDYALTGFEVYQTKEEDNGGIISTMRSAFGSRPKPTRKPRDEGIQTGDIVYMDLATCNPDLVNVIPQIMETSWKGDRDSLTLDPMQLVPFDVSSLTKYQVDNPIPIWFTTPVSFTMGDTYFKWPEPTLMIPNLVSIWNAWYPRNTLEMEEVKSLLLNHISLDYARGQVIKVQTGKNQIHKGWIGLIKLYAETEVAFEALDHLLRLGFITGTGRGRSAGLGRYNILPAIKRENLISMV
ncbi:MAG: CRISPR system precrRNA processing endoribonuclease RAMP protein Cas6 [Methanobacteriota archaeon]|nr:MAG: CRISPR system precrRNA processing endoribonuclease RAMP protein Cas6 [Euryarchaeota archaeon]